MNVEGLLTRPSISREILAPLGVGLAAIVLLAGAIVGARISPFGFAIFGAGLILLAGYAAFRWPRAALVVVVMSPLVDRYIVADILPPSLETLAHLLSEGLLLAVGLVIATRAALDGRVIGALRHPVTLALLAFAAVGVVAAILNGVPPAIAALGFVFTLDATILFFLPRLVGFSLRQSLYAIGALWAIVFGSALLAIGQALLSPTILGLEPSRGRFGEVARLASIFGDPNVFGAFLVVAAPFALFMATTLPTPRLRRLAAVAAFVIVLALWLSYSRGAWIAIVLGVGVAVALIDRRTLLLGLLIAVVSFGTAAVMPRNLLVPRGTGDQPQLIDSTIDRVGAIGLGGDLRTLFVINALPIIRDHPIIGVGPGRYGGAVAGNYGTPIYDRYGTDRLFWNPLQLTVDNFWLHLLVEMGILGFVAFLAAAMIPGLRILGEARRASGWRRIMLGGTAAAVAGMAVSSLTTMLLEANSIGFLFWFLLGTGTVVVASAQREASAQST
ncbi:MAG: O-antigen ligase family protein [Chloroflexi bacterium]|nr:O-antigen ligase family protein [Chloroflexota bacterium]